jgi:hypothetical protein
MLTEKSLPSHRDPEELPVKDPLPTPQPFWRGANFGRRTLKFALFVILIHIFLRTVLWSNEGEGEGLIHPAPHPDSKAVENLFL